MATTGWANEGVNNYTFGWCEPVPGTITSTNATLRTYVYEVYNSQMQFVGWYPTTPANVNFAYTIHGIPAYISSSTTWGGDFDLDGSVTVNNGVTLTISPGTKISFSNNASLTVNGKLIANGTASLPITFTSLTGTSPGSWGSVTLDGTGAAGSILKYVNIKFGTRVEAINTSNIMVQYCNIDTTQNGVYLYNSSGSILNDSITTNSNGHGIRIENGSSATCNDNVVTKTAASRSGVGILVGSGSDADVARNDIYHWDWGIGGIWSATSTANSNYYLEINNRIRNCNTGLMVYRLSYFTYGTPPPSDYMWNSIYGNSYNVKVGTSYPTYASSLIAYGNWWGSNPPNTNLFQVGQEATFYYNPYLSSDPWYGMGKSGAGNNTQLSGDGGINQTLDEENKLLLEGIELRRQNKYREAKDFFISFITNHPENQVAYVQLYNCYSEETANDLINYFSSLPKEASKDHKLLLAYLYLKKADFTEALKVNENIIEENINVDLTTKTKLNNAYIASYNERNINKAIAIYNEVMSADVLSAPLELSLVHQDIEAYAKTYGIEINNLLPSPDIDSFGGELPKQGMPTVTEIPDKYSLLGNYPNPFNPSTTISYALPYQSSVEVVIYDIIGRVVRSFNILSQSAGYQSFVWDGKNELSNSVASGIYLYRISIKSLENNETFIKTAKLMLMK